MNLVPRPLADWFRVVRQRYFLAAVRVTVEEAAADLEAESIGIKKKRVGQAFEALDWAKQLPTDNDEAKQRVLAAFREDLLDIRSITADVLSGHVSPDEGREALHQLPPDAGGSNGSSPVESPKAIENQGGGPNSPPKKRGPGRPTKEEAERRKAQAANGQGQHRQDA